MAFVSTPTFCGSVNVSTATYTTICKELLGKLHSISFVRSGHTLSCPKDTAEITSLVNAGNMTIIHTIDGTMGEPTGNLVESKIKCVSSQYTYYDHPYQVRIPYSLENLQFWTEISEQNFSQIFIVTEEALVREITNIRNWNPREWGEDDSHRMVIDFIERLNTGVKGDWQEAKYPMYDTACEN